MSKEIDGVLTRANFRKLQKISRTTEWRLLNAGELPDTVVLEERILGYRMSSYLEWLDEHTKS